MELTIKIVCPAWMRIAAKIAAPALLVATSGVVFAAQTQFVGGDTLKAADLNGNFTELYQRVGALEEPTFLATQSAMEETPGPNADEVYQSMQLVLSPGTWLVTAQVSARVGVQPDSVQIALWDDTAGAEIPTSRSAWAQSHGTAGTAPFTCDPNGGKCLPAGLSTTAVVTVAAETTLRVKAFRNGNSQLYVGGAVQGGAALPASNRMTAVRLDRGS